ncbi:MAG: 5'/3'-nucleotidase SurE [Alphaproteobacteria bacterium]|nr:5'/3'-nucleotidase SurE [Alphaproteobacteria bacterium]
MTDAALDLASARILISNDDGIHAPGLDVLEKVAQSLSDDVWVVAPDTEQSAASHSLTLRSPLRINRLSDRRYSVSGTPTDAVLLAITHILKDRRPQLVLSGVNRGGNLGEDVTYSGTVAAAMEGTLFDVPSIAFSQIYGLGQPVKWATAEHHLPSLIRSLTAVAWPSNTFINVNFPDVVAHSVKGVRVCRQGRRRLGGKSVVEERFDPRGTPYYWLGVTAAEEELDSETDLAVVKAGAIAVTPLVLDLTYAPMIGPLRKALR